MSKLIKIILVGVPLIVIAVVAVLYLSLNSIVKHGVEALGPEVTKTEVRLDKSSISLFSGKGSLKGLFIGNPDGFNTPSAFKLGEVRIAVDGMTLFSDKIVIHEVYIDAPEITYERKGRNSNINSIMNNIKAFAGASGEDAKKDPAKSEKKIQIDNFIIKNGKVNVSTALLKGKQLTLPLPDIHLKDIGKEEGGKPVSEVMAEVFGAVNKSIGAAVAGSTGGAVKKTTDKIKGFFGK